MKMLSVILISALFLAGCTSYNAINLHKENTGSDYTYYKMQPPLYVGDKVKYSLKDGSKGELTVQKIEPNYLVGNSGQVIPLSELSSLERKDLSKGKTAAAVGGGAVATTVILAVAVTVAMMGAIAAL
ncbi:hypothetical protein [Pantoea sp. B65]|uniref:hypothetical protein n=1 Tax=Pantoea sp. B65 TaxID=2813359 RepID=UPI0039B381BE